MAEKGYRQFIGKVYFKGTILLKTGLHIGGSEDSMQIGGLDLPVIKDTTNNLPYIPGSSLKGKLRSILEKYGKRSYNGKEEALSHNRNIGTWRNPLYIHCCEDIRYAVSCDVCRVFGSSGDDRAMRKREEKAANLPALLYVRDSLLDTKLIGVDYQYTEIKTETGIDRTNMAANPRKVERVVPNTGFQFDLVYNVEALSLEKGKLPEFPEAHTSKDLTNILTCLEILESEGLGGYTSRGYGKVEFRFTGFFTRSLQSYQGNAAKIQGKHVTDPDSDKSFTIKEAREEIAEIVGFLNKEYKSALPV